FASAKEGYATYDLNIKKNDMKDLFEAIVKYIPAPEGEIDQPLQVLISTIDYNDYVGRIGIGKVERGKIKVNQEVIIVNEKKIGYQNKVKITNIYEFEGLKRVEVEEAAVGSIIAVTGVEGIHIGDTICHVEHPEPISFVQISEPTIAMTFSVNDSPFA